MASITFHEKHDDILVCGPRIDSILNDVLIKRVQDGYWYEEEQDLAEQAVSEGEEAAAKFMKYRNHIRAEYETFTIRNDLLKHINQPIMSVTGSE